MSILIFVISNISAVFGAKFIAHLFRGREPWRVGLAGISGFVVLVTAILLLLGNIARLNAISLSVCSVLLLASILALKTRKLIDCRIQSESMRPFQLLPLEESLPSGLPVVVAVLALYFLFAASRATQVQWDDLSYHATVIAQWIKDEKISVISSSYQSYYPFGAELLALWFMLPFKDVSFVSLCGFYWLLLGAVSVYGLVAGLGASANVSVLLSLLFLLSPRVAGLSEFSANDLAATSLMLASIAFCIEGRSVRRSDRRLDAIASGVLVGLAIGCKVTLVIPGLVVMTYWGGVDRRLIPIVARVQLPILFGVGVVVFGSYWYIRNFLLTGNPLFPAQLGPFWGPFDSVSQLHTKAWYWLSTGRIERWQFVDFFRWPLMVGVLTLCGYANYARILLTGAASRNPIKQRWVDSILFSAGLLALASYPFMPFSGTINRPYELPLLSPRYVLIAFVAGLVLCRHLIEYEGKIRRVWLVIAMLAIGNELWALHMGELCALVVLVILFQVAFRLRCFRNSFVRMRFGVAALSITVVLALSHAHKLEISLQNLYNVGGGGSPVGRAWAELEKLPSGSRIAFFMAEPSQYTQYFPLFGSYLQLQPVYTDAEGVSLSKKGYGDFAVSKSEWWGEWQVNEGRASRRKPVISVQQFIVNLKQSRSDYVITSKWSLSQWPPQHEMLKESGAATLIFDDKYSAIWKIN